MKRSHVTRRQDVQTDRLQQTDKSGWIRRFCGRRIFMEVWRNRYVVLRGGQLLLCDKEVKDERRFQEVLDLLDYERSEELRKAKSRSKKSHSRFTLLRRHRPGNTVPNLVFLAVSPEEKESWVNALNVAIVRAKNHILDEVTVEEDYVLLHPTRDRVKIPHSRRLPTRGHLLAVASTSSHEMLTLDLVAEENGVSPDDEGDAREQEEQEEEEEQEEQEEEEEEEEQEEEEQEEEQEEEEQEEQEEERADGCRVDLEAREGGGQGRQRSGTDVSGLRARATGPRAQTGSLPRGSECSWGKKQHLGPPGASTQQHLGVQSRTPPPGRRLSSVQGRSRCASLDQVLSSRPAAISSGSRSALPRCPPEEGPAGGPVQPGGQLRGLIAQRMQRAQELLEELRLQEVQKATAERGGGSSYLKGEDFPRLHHLRSSESPHSSRSSGAPRSRSSDSPRPRGKESPRLRGRESPHSRAKRNSSTDGSSSRSRGSRSPAAGPSASPRPAGRSPQTRRRARGEPVDLRGSSSLSEPWFRSPVQKLRGGERDSPGLSESSDSPRSLLAPPSRAYPPLAPPSRASALLWPGESAVERTREEAERLLAEAVSSWKEAQEVLREVKELQSQTLRRQRRRTYEKMSTAAAEREGRATSPRSQDDKDQSQTS